MLGKSHFLTGALVATPIAIAYTHELAPVLAVSISGGIAATLPDIDEPESRISHSTIIGKLLSPIIAKISGGHRKATHSWIAITLATIGAYLMSRSEFAERIELAVLVGLGISFLPDLKFALLPFLFIVTIFFYHFAPLLAFVLPIGIIVHILGDVLTGHGVPIMWPAKYKLSLPLLGRRVGTLRESLVSLGSLAVITWCYVTFVRTNLHHWIYTPIKLPHFG
jgi:membrane-bound metal-dependent hydrolase YbcI (DUF457 family)